MSIKKIKLHGVKRGIAMIELIFSIVIMGIVLLSAPMLIQQSIRSGNVALQQESIAAAASHTMVILAKHWDENNTDYEAGISPILNTTRVIMNPLTDPFNFNGGILAGLKNNVSGRVSLLTTGDTLSATTTFGTDETNNTDSNESDISSFDDIDDYDNSNFGIMVFNNENTSTDVGDYIDVNLTIHTQIRYAEDRPFGFTFASNNIALGSNINNATVASGDATNVKFINVTLTSNSGIAELQKNITFQAFSCNIGTYVPSGKMK